MAEADPSVPASTERKHLDESPPLMVDARYAARHFSVSVRTWRSLDSAGKIPKPTKLGGRVLWSLEELRLWMEAACPERATWNEQKQNNNRAKK